MCGIVGYTGYRDAFPVILKGLKRLEYRGYDSAGIALHNQSLQVYRKMGKVADLEEHVVGKNIAGHTGIGHTRWATHGEPSDRNAHPHLSASGKLAMIHYGIIENYSKLKQELLQKGYQLNSDTDTEVLLNFIDEIKENNHCSLEEAEQTQTWVMAQIRKSREKDYQNPFRKMLYNNEAEMEKVMGKLQDNPLISNLEEKEKLFQGQAARLQVTLTKK
jgi:glucosamine 6-phosphate synthetase-like amidotransferase/phosphosugar isomerase protein